MKHPLIRRIAATATAGLVVALAACAAAPTEPAPSAPAPAEAETTSVEYSIGVLVPQENQNAYGASYVDNLRKKAEALGVTITLLNSDYTATTQQAQMDQLIAQGVDGDNFVARRIRYHFHHAARCTGSRHSGQHLELGRF